MDEAVHKAFNEGGDAMADKCKDQTLEPSQEVNPWRLTWNIIIEIWKIIFLSKFVICRWTMFIFQGVGKLFSQINAGNMAASLPELVANQLEVRFYTPGRTAGGPQNDGPWNAGNFPFEKMAICWCLAVRNIRGVGCRFFFRWIACSRDLRFDFIFLPFGDRCW